MPTLIRGPAPVVDIDRFLERLNQKKTSPLVQTYARRYAITGRLRENEEEEDGVWLRPKLKPIWAEIRQVTLANIISGIPHEPTSPEALSLAYDWLALITMYRDHIRLSICPVSECRHFFADVKRRGKSACCPEHASRIRARTHYERLKAKPRKYAQYKRKQAKLMRDRRKKGLA